MKNGIAVIGLAFKLPGAEDIDSLWRIINDKIVTVSNCNSRLPLKPGHIQVEGVIKNPYHFDHHYFQYSPQEAEIIDPQQRIFLEGSLNAIFDSGYQVEDIQRTTGVFGGVGFPSYLTREILTNRKSTDIQDDFQVQIANEKDYVATRTAYKLGLEGPVIGIQTACSTALTSIDRARLALLAGECEFAISGAATISCPVGMGYYPRKGGILSFSGACRPFDAAADGTIFSSGAAIFLLRRLEDALQAGDRIYGVIRSSAISNDGNRKVGFPAPSVDGQVSTLKKAYQQEDLDLHQITLIEAHCTGTPIGDPIEVEALKITFSDFKLDPSKKIALASMKGNIGHTDTASGGASLIRALLELNHGIIAPQANFTSINPLLGLDSTPFFIPTHPLEFYNDPYKALVGVTALGIGGTNAHVVVSRSPAGHLVKRNPITSPLKSVYHSVSKDLSVNTPPPYTSISKIEASNSIQLFEPYWRESEFSDSACYQSTPNLIISLRNDDKWWESSLNKKLPKETHIGKLSLIIETDDTASLETFKVQLVVLQDLLNTLDTLNNNHTSEVILLIHGESALIALLESLSIVANQELSGVKVKTVQVCSSITTTRIKGEIISSEINNFNENNSHCIIRYKQNVREVLGYQPISYTTNNSELDSHNQSAIVIGTEYGPAQTLASKLSDTGLKVGMLLHDAVVDKLSMDASSTKRYYCDLADNKLTKKHLERIISEIGEPTNIYVCTRPASEEMLLSFKETSLISINRTWQPMIDGLLSVYSALKDRDLNWIFCSSLSAVLGGPGYTIYSSCSRLQEFLARKLITNDKLRILNIDVWNVAGSANASILNRSGLMQNHQMSTEQGFNAIIKALSTDCSHIIISNGNLATRIEEWITNRFSNRDYRNIQLEDINSSMSIREVLSNIWFELVGEQPIKNEKEIGFFDAGGDSLLAINFVHEISQRLNIKIALGNFFSAGTLSKLENIVTSTKNDSQPSTSTPSCYARCSTISEKIHLSPQSCEEEINFSLFFFSSLLQESASDGYFNIEQFSKFADFNNFTALWVPERHFHPFGGMYPNPAIALSRLSALTKKIQLRAGSVIGPLHNPIRIAEEWSMLDNLSGGRTGIAFGSGFSKIEFGVFNSQNFENRWDKNLSNIEVFKRLWRNRSIYIDDQIKEISLFPTPLQSEIPIWLTAAGNPQTFQAAAKSKLNIVTHLLDKSIEQLKEQIKTYRESWKLAGHSGKGIVTLLIHTYIGTSEEEVIQTTYKPFCNYLETFLDLQKFAIGASLDSNNSDNLSSSDREDLLNYIYNRYADKNALFGTEQKCKSMISHFAKIGVDEFAFLIDFGIESESVLLSLDRLNSIRLSINKDRSYDED